MLPSQRRLNALLILIALQAGAAALWQALEPAAGGLASLSGHLSRLGGVLLLLALCAGAALLAALTARCAERASGRLLFAAGAVFTLGAPLLLAALEALTAGPLFPAYQKYAVALALPAVVYTLSGLELLTAAWLHDRPRLAALLARHPRLPHILAVLALFCLAVLVTRAGVRDLDNLFYGHPGVPVLEWQILLAAAAGLILAAFAARLRPAGLDLLDRGMFVLLWLGAALLWLAQPAVPGGYALAPQAPNFELYPFSDAMSYDAYAQSLLVGAGFNGMVPPRPLYVTLLAGLHAVAGPGYAGALALQTLLLAVFPALLYLLAARLGGRPTGLMLALLTALRDLNTNAAAPFATNISYSKLFLSELPTAILLAVFALLLTRWARRGLADWHLPLLAGGLAGLAALFRTQSLIVLPAAFLLLLIPGARAWRRWLRGLIFATAAAALAVSPWLARNYQLTGGLVFDDPATQTMVLAQRYGSVYFANPIVQEPGETTAAYTSRLMAFALDNLRRDPARILSAAAAHWVNNLAGSLRVLPFRAAVRAPGDFIAPAWPFWETRLAVFGAGLRLLLGLCLLVFAFGLSTACARLGWAGLLPLVINLSYNLWSALFLTSGERFLLPVDWAFLLYFCAGVFALLALPFPRLLTPADVPAETRPAAPLRPWATLLLPGAFLLAGAAIPLAERLVPPRYPAADQAALLARLDQKGLDLPTDGLTVLEGRLLYPLYFPAGGGIAGVEDVGYRALPQARLVFRVAGPRSVLAVLPLSAAPDFFPHGADVLVLGREEAGVFVARAAWVEQDGAGRLLTASAP
jgi:hypothetical protein